MQQGPQLLIATQDDMSAPASISSVGACQSIIFGMHKMPDTRPTMTAFAKYPDLIYKVRFFQIVVFSATNCKDKLSASDKAYI